MNLKFIRFIIIYMFIFFQSVFKNSSYISFFFMPLLQVRQAPRFMKRFFDNRQLLIGENHIDSFLSYSRHCRPHSSSAARFSSR